MTITPREEAARKTIHVVLSLVAAAVVWRLPALEAAIVLAAAALLALVVETARSASDAFRARFERWVGPLLRDSERARLTGATTLAIGYTLAAVVLPGTPALVGVLVAGVADSVAAVVGKRFGRVRYRGGKTAEGSGAFLVVVVLLLLPLPGSFLRALGAAVVLTILEAPTLRVPDNLYLPLAAAAVVRWTHGLPALTFFS